MAALAIFLENGKHVFVKGDVAVGVRFRAEGRHREQCARKQDSDHHVLFAFSANQCLISARRRSGVVEGRWLERMHEWENCLTGESGHADPKNQKWLAEQPPKYIAIGMRQLRAQLRDRAYGNGRSGG